MSKQVWFTAYSERYDTFFIHKTYNVYVFYWWIKMGYTKYSVQCHIFKLLFMSWMTRVFFLSILEELFFLYLGVTPGYVWNISIGKPLRWLGYATLSRFELSLSCQKIVKMAPKNIIKLLFWQIYFSSTRSRVYLGDFKFYPSFYLKPWSGMKID